MVRRYGRPDDEDPVNTANDLGADGRFEVTVDGAIASVTLSRPHKLNALDVACLEGLTHIAGELNRDDAVKVVVIRGAGRAFCAGFDLNQERRSDAEPLVGSPDSGRAMADALSTMRAVTIASVHGHCIGGGVVLAAACDLRVAARGARFRIPEVDLGVPLYWAGIPLLTRELGPAITKELVMTGREFGADEAQRFGFVNSVVADDELDAATAELALVLASKSAFVLSTTKRQVNNAWPPLGIHDEGAEAEIEGMAAAFADPESRRVAHDYLTRTLGGAG